MKRIIGSILLGWTVFASPVALGQTAGETGPQLGKLQGAWRSLDDPKSVLEFSGSRKTDIYDGEAVAANDVAAVGFCDGAAPGSEVPGTKAPGWKLPDSRLKDYYLVEPGTGLCWYVIEASAKTLELSHVGRGNMLRYRRVEP
ncbi:MAG: hypothetical protein O3A96_11675 [Proteobacteria bacterium]|nr:hypothetical protein [Pseudomonadota bacterium]